MQRNPRRLQFWLLIVLTFGCLSSAAYAIPAYGVTTTNQLVRFDTTTPNAITVIGSVTGLQAGETILGIDFRPANGQLYALGSSNRLYTININTGAAAQVGNAGAFTLAGTSFGFDFNPMVDRIRVVSNTGQNLRLNPTDGSLTAADTAINPSSFTVTGSAYTNNIINATTTTLFDIDTTNLGTLFTQNPPNAGTLVVVGQLGVQASGTAGFDIAQDGTAFAALTVANTLRLYQINLNTGAASLVGSIGDGTLQLVGFAVALSNTGMSGGGRIKTVLDFDGDMRTDPSVYRTPTSTFFVRRSTNGTTLAQQFGIAGTDIPVPGDYDGDNRTDIAVFRPTTGFFFILQSTTGTIRSEQFGLGTDQPIPGDYDGDNRDDLAVVRRMNGQLFFFIRNSSNGSFRAEQFGLDTDVVAPGDYDGDRRFDLAVFRTQPNGEGVFFIRLSGGGGDRAVQFGLGSDIVVPGDYDGDGRYDLAVVRPGTQFTWFILQSSTNTVRTVGFGAKPQILAPGDYDGDGRTDIATFDPITGNFLILQSTNNAFTFIRFGNSQDTPLAAFNTF